MRLVRLIIAAAALVAGLAVVPANAAEAPATGVSVQDSTPFN